MVRTLDEAASATADVARGVRQDQFANSTPCGDWNVEQLMNHLTGSLEYFAARAEGSGSGSPQPAPQAAFPETIERLSKALAHTAAAWGRPGALEQKIDSGKGSMPGAALASMAASEMLVHGWDLAKATGQRLRVDNGDVDELLGQMQKILPPDARKPAFGPEVQVDKSAGSLDRLAAFLGRTP